MSSRRLLVATDLDGCLLDSATYAWAAARPALAALAEAGCPLVLCSGKTRAEMAPLARAMGLDQPLIVENGGAIVFPPGSFPGELPGALCEGGASVLVLGLARRQLVDSLRELAGRAGVRVRGFADLGLAELQALTGLSGPAAELAQRREYDEPFLVDGDEADVRALSQLAACRGLRVSHGGRFHHLSGASDKGLALGTLLALYVRSGQAFFSLGLGDAPTDLPLLRAVDRPLVVPRPDGSLDPLLAAELPQAERAPGPGPAGWNAAVLEVLAGRGLPRLRATEAGERP